LNPSELNLIPKNKLENERQINNTEFWDMRYLKNYIAEFG